MNALIDTNIREFLPADADPVMHLIHDTIDSSYKAVYPQQALNFFKGFHSREKIMDRALKGNSLVMEKGGKIIGTGSFLKGEILGIFVKTAFQRLGCGRMLMAELERIAASENFSKVTLSVPLSSRRFYEILGYSIYKESPIVVKNGKHLAYWKASKLLGRSPEIQPDRRACLRPPDRSPGSAAGV